MAERTGRSERYFKEAHIRRYGSETANHSEGSGAVAVPRVIEEMKPIAK
jgi:hypothetical protein